MGQHYFQIEHKYYKTDAILANAYILNIEHKQMYPILINHQIIGYFRYVNDILIIYD
jgi:hypothetical protein